MKFAIAVAAALVLAGCGQKTEMPANPPAAADPSAKATTPKPVANAFATQLDAALAGSWRSEQNKARDGYRHPKETLAFFGVGSGLSVVEITPGAGWYSELLAPALKGDGTYVAAIASAASSDYNKRGNERIRAKFGEDATRYGEVKYAEFDPKAPALGMDGAVDVVLTFRNVHNWVSGDTAPAMFEAFYRTLKPGGVLGVVEHRAAAGADMKSIKESGYLPTDFVVKLATDAGFELAAQSEINANPKDTKDYEKGVWTLPPSLTLGDVDRDKYIAIGESDRMTLKFVKPKGDRIFEQGTDSGAAGGDKK